METYRTAFYDALIDLFLNVPNHISYSSETEELEFDHARFLQVTEYPEFFQTYLGLTASAQGEKQGMNQMFTNFLQILKPRLQRDLDEEDMLVAQHVRNSIHQKATSSSPKLKKES